MRAIVDTAREELLWVQPAARKQWYELRAGDEILATLRWQRQTLAEADSADGRWTFKREGFWRPQVTVRSLGSEENAATFRPHWMGGGTLEIPGQPTISLVAADFWHSQWEWRRPDGLTVVHFKSRQGISKVGGEVQIAPEALRSADVGLLVLLGWYLIVLLARDSAAASASGGAVVAST